MNLLKDGLAMLEKTSRTFFIPISRLPKGLKEAVTSAYLCMRAIDEIEDHPDLDSATKAKLLQIISISLQQGVDAYSIDEISRKLQKQHHLTLPDVSLRVGEWAAMAPADIAPRIWDATAAMADRMAYWSVTDWQVHTEADLDCYTFSVAGSVGLLLSDLWSWYDGTKTDRAEAVGFGRGLQAVNILRNHDEDLLRGVNFFPDGWTAADVHQYARRNLDLAESYTKALPIGPVLDFCQIPLTLATATLDALAQGEQKLSRTKVLSLIASLTTSRS